MKSAPALSRLSSAISTGTASSSSPVDGDAARAQDAGLRRGTRATREEHRQAAARPPAPSRAGSSTSAIKTMAKRGGVNGAP